MAELIWTEPALRQLEEIADWIALDKPAAAKAVVRRIAALTDHLGRFERMGRAIPEFRHPDFRQVWIPPCWIYYRREEGRIYVLHVRRAEKSLRLEDRGSNG